MNSQEKGGGCLKTMVKAVVRAMIVNIKYL